MRAARLSAVTAQTVPGGRGVARAPLVRRRRTPLQRCFATLLMLLFAMSSFESLIADVHDGDAQESVRVTTVANAATASLATGASCASSGITDVSYRTGISADADCHAPRTPTHDVHVCHCAHAHAVTLSRAMVTLSGMVATTTSPLPHECRMPASADRARMLRPPVALLSA